MREKILVAEDDESISSALKDPLERRGFQVKIAEDGEQALGIVDNWEPDLVVLDIMMPKLDGWSVCKELRKRKSYIPVIMLTVLNDSTDHIKGLAIGADHYFTKPFDTNVLIAQIEATLNTVQASRDTPHTTRLIFDRLEIDLDRWKIWMAGREIELTPTEFKLLRVLSEHPGTVFGREMLIEKVWGWDPAGEVVEPRVVDRHIAELRRKLEPNPRVPQYILAVRGIGYKFRECY